MATKPGLVCPKCGGRMLRYERTGIFVEQCQACRGIFLDYGELENLIDAEGGGWSGRIAVRGDRIRLGRESEERREKTLRDLFGD